MKWHVIRRHVQNSWKRRWVRICVSATVLVLVLCVQYFVSRIPEPQVVEKTEYSPAIFRAGQQQLVILGPVLPTDVNVLLKAEGKNHQTVEFRATQARLTSDMVSSIARIYEGRRRPPAGLEEIDYLIARDEEVTDETVSTPNPQSVAGNLGPTDSCTTSVTVRTIDGKLPSEVRLYQPEKGSQTFQALEISAIGADLEVLIEQSQPDTKKPEGNPWAPGCKRTLDIGKDFHLVHHGMFNLSFIVPADSTFRLDFHSLGPTYALHSASGLFEPVLLGLKARALKVIPYPNSVSSPKPAQPHLSVEADGDPKNIDINGLKSSDEEMRLNFSGLGLIKVNGKTMKTFNLLDLALQYPIVATIFTLMNGALAGWIWFSIKRPS